jgi:hypothetical protein
MSNMLSFRSMKCLSKSIGSDFIPVVSLLLTSFKFFDFICYGLSYELRFGNHFTFNDGIHKLTKLFVIDSDSYVVLFLHHNKYVELAIS